MPGGPVEPSVGGVLYSLMSGLFIQRFADPGRVPAGADMAAGVRALAEWLTKAKAPTA